MKRVNDEGLCKERGEKRMGDRGTEKVKLRILHAESYGVVKSHAGFCIHGSGGYVSDKVYVI